VEIKSHSGEGTLITVRLPLTLAIIDGFHVNSAGTNFIVPQATIVECLDFNSVRRLEGGNSIQLRGELVPYVPLQELLDLSGTVSNQKKLVVVQFGEERAAVVVDELFGELQTVVKPLSPIFGNLKGIGGCSLLGNGDIAFILDIPQLIALATTSEARRTAGHITRNRTRAHSDHLH
jgi:two-component system, chemotaxis family, sensor kinase CheA